MVMFTLFQAFQSIKTQEEFDNFLKDLCTPSEVKDFNDRFAIAQLLFEGKLSQRAISDKIKCSITTVTRVARFLNNENYGGYRTVLKKLTETK